MIFFLSSLFKFLQFLIKKHANSNTYTRIFHESPEIFFYGQNKVFMAINVFMATFLAFWKCHKKIISGDSEFFWWKRNKKFACLIYFSKSRKIIADILLDLAHPVPYCTKFCTDINWFYSPSFEMLHFKTAEKVSTNRTMSTNRMSTSRAMDCIKLHLHGAISPTPTWVIHCRLIGLLKCASNATASCVCFIFSWSAFFW